MEFLKKNVEWGTFELILDSNIFPKDIILRSAYMFLDKGYFFFKTGATDNQIILQFTPKDGIKTSPEVIIWEYSDELLNMYLRDRLEKDNQTIREAIVKTAIQNSIDSKNFTSIEGDNNQKTSTIDFDKDIDEILREIENDPDLKVDEAEIAKILAEIEHETQSEISNNPPVLDPKKINDAKKMFQDK